LLYPKILFSALLFQSFFAAIAVTSVVCRLAKCAPFRQEAYKLSPQLLSFASLKLTIRSDFVDPKKLFFGFIFLF